MVDLTAHNANRVKPTAAVRTGHVPAGVASQSPVEGESTNSARDARHRLEADKSCLLVEVRRQIGKTHARSEQALAR